mgnify:CR=1 FL=1
MKQVHIFFKGMVQGVGFRYTTLRIAKELQLTGWVKNLKDGRVEAMVQGNPNVIDQLCVHLKEHFGDYLQDVEKVYIDELEDFSDFHIY